MFPGGSRPKTKPGNKDSISKLIRATDQLRQSKSFHHVSHNTASQLFRVAIFHNQFPEPRLYSPTFVNKSPLISIFIDLRVGGQECRAPIMKTRFQLWIQIPL